MRRYPRLTKRPHENYDDLFINPIEDFRELIAELANPERLTPGRLLEISGQTGIKCKTLEEWRGKLKKDPNYRPEHGRKGRPLRLTPEMEHEVAKSIKEDYIDKQRLCPRAAVQALLTEKGQEIDPDFSAGRTLVDKFLERSDYSMRMPHMERRTVPNDGVVASFVNSMEVAQMQWPDGEMLINVDETCWRICNGRLSTVAPTGSDAVIVRTGTDMKTSITAIAACTMSGQRLPLWVLARGLTPDCEEKFRGDIRLRHYVRSGLLMIDHTKNGWSDGDFAGRYLSWVRSYVGQPCHVVWDLHASHRVKGVQETASTLGVGLSFIPAGQTGEWQPLDRRIFGELKMRSVGVFSRLMIHKSMDQVDIVVALKILVMCWQQVSEESIIKAWDHISG